VSQISSTEEQFAWRQQTALNLYQLVAWVMLRDPLAVERIGDNAGQDAPNSYSQRDPALRHRMLASEIERVGGRRRFELGDAVAEIKRHLRAGELQYSARRTDAGDRLPSRRISIDALEWHTLDLNFSTGGVLDRDSGIEWADARFAIDDVTKLLPAGTAPTAVDVASNTPTALSTLLAANVSLDGGNEVTVYDLVSAAAGASPPNLAMDAETANAHLRRHGMKVLHDTGQPARSGKLMLQNNSVHITRLLEGTPFQADWKRQFLRSGAAVRHTDDRGNLKQERFNSYPLRCIAVSLATVISDLPLVPKR
jgi:hypothetical protein